MSLGIKIDLDDPGCPYQNGGYERMHKDMKRELQANLRGDMKVHQQEFDRWRQEFNEVRPHEDARESIQKIQVEVGRKRGGTGLPGEYENRDSEGPRLFQSAAGEDIHGESICGLV
jgi:hypothetical protein